MTTRDDQPRGVERSESDGGGGARGPARDRGDGGSGASGGGSRGGGLFQLIKFALLGFGVSSPDERRENFRKWERYRQQREAEQKWYGGKSLDEQVREEHQRLTRDAAARKGGGTAGGEKADGADRA